MQYILTQKEYDDLRAKQEHSIQMSEKKLLTLCRSIANTMPVKWGWSKNEEAKPWGCHMDSEHEWYCDSCPVQDICPGEQHWSQ
jgi:hypothetical protein